MPVHLYELLNIKSSYIRVGRLREDKAEDDVLCRHFVWPRLGEEHSPI